VYLKPKNSSTPFEVSVAFDRGFTARNLFNMIKFAEVFPDEQIAAAVQRQ
jgi:hypothetical protein